MQDSCNEEWQCPEKIHCSFDSLKKTGCRCFS